MRQVVVDTETTGLEPSQGHRIIEIGCVELLHRRFTTRHFHCYLQPDREIDAGALDVHGITTESLRDRPRFGDIAGELLAFLDQAELVIHNAPFDTAFFDYELSLLSGDHGRIADRCTILDTLALARELHPGQRNSLDALCKRYDVDNSQRVLHGALLDAEILADVYLAMTGGQASLALQTAVPRRDAAVAGHDPSARRGEALVVLRATAGEREAHDRQLRKIDEESDGKCIWLRQGA